MLYCALLSILILLQCCNALFESFDKILDKAITQGDDISGILNGKQLPELTAVVDPCPLRKDLKDCVNQLDGDGNTALHKLVYRWSQAKPHQQENLNHLLNAGADVNIQNKWEATPLHFAAEKMSSDTRQPMAILLQHGANVNIVDGMDRTPLAHVVYQVGQSAKSTYPDDDAKIGQEMFEMLISNGADVNGIVNGIVGDDDTILDYLIKIYDFAVDKQLSQYVNPLQNMIQRLIHLRARANNETSLSAYIRSHQDLAQNAANLQPLLEARG